MKKIMMVCITLFLSNITFANNIFVSEKPKSCPSASEIISVGLSPRLVRDNDGKWYAGRTSRSYGTTHKWTFVIGGITAANASDALIKANAALLTLTFKSGPSKQPAEKWLCLYNNASNYLAGAVTPPINEVAYSTINN